MRKCHKIETYKLNDYKKLENICGVYTFIDKNNNIVYIGSSWSVGNRIDKHIYLLKSNHKKCNKKLLQAWNNKEIINIGLLEKCKTPLEAEQKEQKYIKKWQTKLLNTTSHYKITISNEGIERFWNNVSIKEEQECWEWLGNIPIFI